MNIERLILILVMRLFALCELIALLTSCSPYVELPTATPTARQTVTPAPQRKPTVIKFPTPFPTCTVRTGIPDGIVNLRTGAGVSHAVIRVVHEGEKLSVVQRAAWLQVIDARGNRGFINSRYCK